ncbi:hypothetical protein UK15_14620 [Streptomyces variegatus]|jgi:hypothetical protein|uniref:Peptidase inhibitor family I36 n=1 Tax=Streptomyces variegatus TaxID=284040 RepID=A0A0M2GSR3_9ACTN|nr:MULTISPECIES: hypothetical protein [Streptomyces]KJK39161.1 hypothetical protein UK15_14620 [Streptomyces variegatus]
MRFKRVVSTSAVLGGVLAAGLVTAPPAAAVASDCKSGEVCLYYNSSSYDFGAVFIQRYDVADYSGRYFSSGYHGSAGSGTVVKNHAAAVDSWQPYKFVVYYNSSYNCSVACQTILPWESKDLNSSLKNNNASGRVEG